VRNCYIESIVCFLHDIQAEKTLRRVYCFVQALWRKESKPAGKGVSA